MNNRKYIPYDSESSQFEIRILGLLVLGGMVFWVTQCRILSVSSHSTVQREKELPCMPLTRTLISFLGHGDLHSYVQTPPQNTISQYHHMSGSRFQQLIWKDLHI